MTTSLLKSACGKVLYKCNICVELFDSRAEHRRHLRQQHAFKQCQCDHCYEVFDNAEILAEHEQTHPQYSSLFYCSNCFETFSTEVGRLKHSLHHNKPHRSAQRLKKESSTPPPPPPKPNNPKMAKSVLKSITANEQKPPSATTTTTTSTTTTTTTTKLSDVVGRKSQMISSNNNVVIFMCEECGECFQSAQILASHKLQHEELVENLPHHQFDDDDAWDDNDYFLADNDGCNNCSIDEQVIPPPTVQSIFDMELDRLHC